MSIWDNDEQISRQRHTHRAGRFRSVSRESERKYYLYSEKKEWNKWPDTLSWCCQAGNKVAITEYMKMKWISVRRPGLREREREQLSLGVHPSLPLLFTSSRLCWNSIHTYTDAHFHHLRQSIASLSIISSPSLFLSRAMFYGCRFAALQLKG